MYSSQNDTDYLIFQDDLSLSRVFFILSKFMVTNSKQMKQNYILSVLVVYYIISFKVK